jgi:hypothetical protein
MAKKIPAAVREYLQEMGRQGGLKGGKRSLVTMTRAQRIARARKASKKAAEARTATALARKQKRAKAENAN